METQCEAPLRGAEVVEGGVLYGVWAPVCRAMEVEVCAESGARRAISLELCGGGWFRGVDAAGRAGDRYKFRLNSQQSFPDPASRWQPEGVHGPSMVIDPSSYHWTDGNWRPAAFRDLVIYELHIGAFTPAGTFRGAIEKLPYLRDLGVTAIEIMPICEFPGGRNWGYDGVFLFAPSRAYGHPDDLRALVNAAHACGLTVILDVVYNHFGPDGNYLGCYIGNYLDESKKTPWGGAIRYGDPEFLPLRTLVLSNPVHWMREYHVDGFRLDATHAIADASPRHLLTELTAAIHANGGFAIAEDSRNDSRLLLSEAEGGFGFDGVWADDFHHTVRVSNTHESDSYLGDFSGSLGEVLDTMRHGWLYRGQHSRGKGARRGSECRHIPPERFVHCISNHDQIGNRAMGDRLSDSISPEAYRAALALVCLSPYTPLLFMGQEWMASTPFLFFTDHNPELGRLVTQGRREEFKEFASFRLNASVDQIPDPQSQETFIKSKVCWDEKEGGEKKGAMELVKECLGLRRADSAFRPRDRDAMQVAELAIGIGALRLSSERSDWLLLFNLAGKHDGSARGEPMVALPAGYRWNFLFSSNGSRFGGAGPALVNLATGAVCFDAPELVVLRAVGC